MFRLQMAWCTRPLVDLGSFMNESRPQGSWVVSRTLNKKDIWTSPTSDIRWGWRVGGIFSVWWHFKEGHQSHRLQALPLSVLESSFTTTLWKCLSGIADSWNMIEKVLPLLRWLPGWLGMHAMSNEANRHVKSHAWPQVRMRDSLQT